MKNSRLKKIVTAMTIVMCMSTPMTVLAQGHGEYPTGEILTFGSDLSDSQEAELRKYFNAPDNIEAIYVDNKVAAKQLGFDENQVGTGGWYSSAYVKLKAEESGVTVKSNKLTVVTNDMLANALITSGIYNAEVNASAPFDVTGESALAGILAGAEKIMGGELKTQNKQAAQEEIEVSMDLAEEVGQTEAAAVINDVKTKVIKEKPKTDEEIGKIVDETSKKYDINITNETKEQIVVLMNKINDLDIDYDAVKDVLSETASKFKDELAALGKQLQDSGFFDRLFAWVKDLFNSIFNKE
ncbi:MAG: DUF1002 domain-containing protein [Clostridium sp.]|nr:DUF1002 domain-containing protein [Clostridium sp.]